MKGWTAAAGVLGEGGGSWGGRAVRDSRRSAAVFIVILYKMVGSGNRISPRSYGVRTLRVATDDRTRLRFPGPVGRRRVGDPPSRQGGQGRRGPGLRHLGRGRRLLQVERGRLQGARPAGPSQEPVDGSGPERRDAPAPGRPRGTRGLPD